MSGSISALVTLDKVLTRPEMGDEERVLASEEAT